MPRPAGALAVALATAVFALVLVAPSPVEAQVTVEVTCPSEQNPQLVVKVEPWVYEVEEGDPGEWILSIEDDIEVAAKKPGKWPWKKEKIKDKKKVKFKDWKDNVEKKDYYYNITVHCGATSAVIDPRVRVR